MTENSNFVVRSRAPLRLGLAGGGSDLSPFSEKYGGNVLNATIDLFAQSILEPRNDGKIEFFAADRDEKIILDSIPKLPITANGNLNLHKGIYNRIVNEYNNGNPLSFKLTTYADAPAGSGLGTSSTMVVCIIKAFSEWLKLDISDYKLANLAYIVERIDLGFSGGKQDQYAASFGGFNFIEFGPGDKILVNPLRVSPWIINELESSTVLFYTGQSRDSSKIISTQVENISNVCTDSFRATVLLKEDAIKLKSAILRGSFSEYGKILSDSWENKKKLSSSVSSIHLDDIYKAALDSGAISGKISGAGGGGFFMFYVNPCNRTSLIRTLEKFNGQVVNFNFEFQGAQSWIAPK
jgi:D-glycero-alpha-D-manno-heptose-7-phosphate kinase